MGGISRFVTRIKELKARPLTFLFQPRQAESVARGEYEAVVLFSGDAFNPSLMWPGLKIWTCIGYTIYHVT